MRFFELNEGAVLRNKERVAILRNLISQAGGNPKCKISAAHKTFNNIQYQRLTLTQCGVMDSEQLKQQITAAFDDLVKIEGNLVLYFKYQLNQ